jgi:GT2 family glycosyltransferase
VNVDPERSTPSRRGPDPARPSLSVVVPTYRRRASLPALVTNLLDQEPDEVVVVVDGDEDGSVALLDRMAREDRRLRPVGRDNGGIAAARQTGLDAATGDVVLFVDDDVVPRPGLVTGHRERHRRRRGLVVVGYMPNDPEALSGVEWAIARLYARSYEATVSFYERHPDRILTRLWGGNFSIERDAARAVGMVSPIRHPRGHEDREFGLRCLQHGLTGRFDRTLRVEHRYRRSLDGFRRDGQLSGAYRVQLHAEYPDLTAATPVEDPAFDDRPGPNLPAPLRTALPFIARTPIRHAVVGGLRAALRTPIVVRSRRLTLNIVRGIGSIEVQAGVNETLGSQRPSRRGRSSRLLPPTRRPPGSCSPA